MTLRSCMRHAGGVRIDHAMGLMHLWIVPHGAKASEGAYLTYPLRDLLRLTALESHRHRAIVIGEDLGTVPDGFRDQLEQARYLRNACAVVRAGRQYVHGTSKLASRRRRNDVDPRFADSRRLVAWQRP